MSVVWSILAIIIAAVVCYFIYEEYIVEHPEESDAELDIEGDLQAMAAEAGMSGFDSLPDSRSGDAAPAIEAGGAAVIGEPDATDADASADEPVAAADVADDDVVDVTAVEDVAVEDVAVEDVVADDIVVEDAAAVDVADDVADEAVEEADATMNAVVVEDPADDDVAAAEDVAEAEEDEIASDRTVTVPIEVDDLTKIKGIGKVYAQRLNAAGITSYQQIMDTDVDTLESIAQAIPAANAYDWARQAGKLVDG